MLLGVAAAREGGIDVVGDGWPEAVGNLLLVLVRELELVLRIGVRPRQQLPHHYSHRVAVSLLAVRLPLQDLRRLPERVLNISRVHLLAELACSQLHHSSEVCHLRNHGVELTERHQEDVWALEVAVDHGRIGGVQEAHALGDVTGYAEAHAPGEVRHGEVAQIAVEVDDGPLHDHADGPEGVADELDEVAVAEPGHGEDLLARLAGCLLVHALRELLHSHRPAEVARGVHLAERALAERPFVLQCRNVDLLRSLHVRDTGVRRQCRERSGVAVAVRARSRTLRSLSGAACR
mmetsp:Transcript_3314/g.11639  ORF Transcript_3314/g.11639 Transcript_3314/m.11639 type:complete len:292 (-) Transcript_3314:119-994(-)